ncbi:hypothetical protein CMI37_38530 [Candidatus Pacearchaeota archaeon]|nr:hypothetical protein [Candidatus Pacearchaeota archaeon]|tara:strand:+ start:1180 stop:1422 length:243 start_codon:yes stop_codon:yes gene_type:complete
MKTRMIEDFCAVCDRLFDEDIDGDDNHRQQWFRECFMRLAQGRTNDFHDRDIMTTIYKLLFKGFSVGETYGLAREVLDNQ